MGGWAGYGTSRKCKSVKKRGQVKNKLCKAAKQSKGLGQTKRSEAKESKPETEKKRQNRQREMEPEVASDQYSSEEKWERVYLE